MGIPAALLTLVNGEEGGSHRSKEGIADIVTSGIDLCDHFPGANGFCHCHSPVWLTAGEVDIVAQPGATSSPLLAQPHSRESDEGTA